MAWFQLVGRNEAPTFDEWRAEGHRRSPVGFGPDDEAVVWAWEAIRMSPWAADLGWQLPPASRRWVKPILALPAGTEVYVVLGPDPDRIHLGTRDSLGAHARVSMAAPWYLEGTQGDRLQARAVECVVTVRPTGLGTVAEEALRFGVPLERVKLRGDEVEVSVGSLNQAYTVASRRLEPDRASHGGRFFERTFVRSGNAWLSLEKLRCAAEAGTWPGLQ